MTVLTHSQNHIGDGTRSYPRSVDSSVGDVTMAGNTKKMKGWTCMVKSILPVWPR